MEEFLKTIGINIEGMTNQQIKNAIFNVYPYLDKEQKQEVTRILILLEREREVNK